jgi:hypothetical protein
MPRLRNIRKANRKLSALEIKAREFDGLYISPTEEKVGLVLAPLLILATLIGGFWLLP